MFIKNKKLLILSIFLIAILAISAGSAAAADIQDDSSSPILMDGDVPAGDDTGGDGPSDPGTNPGGDNPADPGTNTGGDDPTDPSGEGGETPDPQENTPKETTLTVTADSVTVGSDVAIDFNLKDSEGANVDGPVILAFADYEPVLIQLVEGHGSETFGALPIGQYAYTLTFEGNDDYAPSTASGTFKVTPVSVSTFSELQNALKNEKISEIKLTNNIVMTSTITINRANTIIIDGNGKAVDGKNKVGLFKIYGNTVTMKNLILKGGKNGGLGGAIDLHGKLTVNNCTFVNNTGTGSAATSAAGGAIFAREGS
uniref:pectate lyase-like adhesive domain-containing protein n=1 Tax=Methanobrevibacter sp. TaxID=66852 RepID=UPI0038907235